MTTKQRHCILGLLSIILMATMGCMGARVHAKPGTSTTVILIRHADRDDIGHLTSQGHARAKALIDTVGHMGIAAIYSPNLERNIDTVKPLAEHLGIPITLKPKISMPKAYDIAKELVTQHAGSVVLWVGNVSGNLEAIHYRLGGKGEGPTKYGQLFIMTVRDEGPTKVVKSHFGM